MSPPQEQTEVQYRIEPGLSEEDVASRLNDGWELVAVTTHAPSQSAPIGAPRFHLRKKMVGGGEGADMGNGYRLRMSAGARSHDAVLEHQQGAGAPWREVWRAPATLPLLTENEPRPQEADDLLWQAMQQAARDMGSGVVIAQHRRHLQGFLETARFAGWMDSLRARRGEP